MRVRACVYGQAVGQLYGEFLSRPSSSSKILRHAASWQLPPQRGYHRSYVSAAPHSPTCCQLQYTTRVSGPHFVTLAGVPDAEKAAAAAGPLVFGGAQISGLPGKEGRFEVLQPLRKCTEALDRGRAAHGYKRRPIPPPKPLIAICKAL